MASAEDLNYDCNYNIFLAKTQLVKLTSLNDRQRALKWIRKLASCHRTVQEMKLRNDLLYYLVLNVQAGELKKPFTDDPPTELLSLSHLLPGGVDKELKEDASEHWTRSKPQEQKPLLYEQSPDGGAFLAAQPVPRCGAFCYLAVVSRNKFKD